MTMDRNDQRAIESLFEKLANVERQSPPRDAEAEAFIREQIARQPGATYYMAQTIVVQEQALNAAQARIEELEQQPGSRQSSGGSLLSGILGDSRQSVAFDRLRAACRTCAAAEHAAGAIHSGLAAASSPAQLRRRWASRAASCSATRSPACSAATRHRPRNRRLMKRMPEEASVEDSGFDDDGGFDEIEI